MLHNLQSLDPRTNLNYFVLTYNEIYTKIENKHPEIFAQFDIASFSAFDQRICPTERCRPVWMLLNLHDESHML